MAVDESRQGLLKRISQDGRNSLDSTSDLDADYLEKKPTTHRLHKRSYCRTILAILGTVLILIGAAGMFGYKKYNDEPPYGQSPPWYPTPKGGTVKEWAESYAKAAKMVSKMSLPEKVNVTTGTGWSMGLAVGNTGPAIHVGFPGLALQDGPLGIRMADNITAFPAGITVGATWNKQLMYDRGKAHALEARAKGINVLLGPAIGPLGRMPAGGRNWEGFGPDPYLQGIAGAQTIRGIQEQHVMATIKHFIGNEQEHFRQAREWALPQALSSNIDDRTLHEIYAWPFADAVRAGVASVMCSYNQVNNSYACENSKLLNGVLKDEMGFQGFVMSDWLAQRAGVASALAGLDMTMPGDGLKWMDGESLWGPQLTKAVLNGSMPVERVNDMAVRIVAAWYQLGQDDTTLFDRKGPNFSSFTNEKMGIMAVGSPTEQEVIEVNKFVDVQKDHRNISRQVAVEGTVLVKNDGILPLSRGGQGVKIEGKLRVGIFGEDAGPGKGPNHCNDRGCNQGTLASGWGSGAVEFPYLVPPIEALRDAFDSQKVEITEYLKNDLRYSKKPHLFDQDICIVFGNSDAGEGFIKWGSVAGDRNNLLLQKDGEELVKDIATHCSSTIVIIHAVGPVVVENWIDLPNVKAVLLANLPGQESGNALVDLLFGNENPSGKLPYTVGKSLEDYGEGGSVMYTPNGMIPQQDFKEGLYIDYRHFDKHGIEPRFEFGFGLSYTIFEYGNLQIIGKKGKTALPRLRPVGMQPPEFEAGVPPVDEVLFPEGIRRLEKYIYPYLDSLDDVKVGEYTYPKGYDTAQQPSEAGGAQGGNPDLWEVYVTISVDVSNTGPVAGKVVAQLYMSYPDKTGVDFPMRVLRGFEKVRLQKGESKTIEFEVTRRDLSYWDVKQQNWVMLTGEYVFAVGGSSRDIKLKGAW